jgi:stage III sporulation protein AE
MEKIGQWLCDALLYEIKTGKTILVEVVLLAAGFSMLKNFSGTFEKNYVSDICFLLVYGVLCVLLLKSFEIYGTVAEEALNGSIDFMKALIPAFGISMVFSSGAESSAVFYQLAFLVIYLVEWLFLSVLLPFIRVYVVTELFNHFFEDEKFQNFTELLAGVISWGMKSAMMVVLGLNVMQGLLAPAKDRLLNGAVSRAAMMIPGVLGGIGELMFGAGILIKNCVGVTALIVLLAVGCIPVLKLACMSVLYKLAAAVAEPVADKRIVGCIKSMAQGGVLYLKLVCYGIVLFFATIALQTAAVTSHA